MHLFLALSSAGERGLGSPAILAFFTWYIIFSIYMKLYSIKSVNGLNPGVSVVRIV